MTREDFIQQAIAAGKSQEDTKAIYDKIDASNGFDDNIQQKANIPQNNQPQQPLNFIQQSAKNLAPNTYDAISNSKGFTALTPIKAGFGLAQDVMSFPARSLGQIMNPTTTNIMSNPNATATTILAEQIPGKNLIAQNLRYGINAIGDPMTWAGTGLGKQTIGMIGNKTLDQAIIQGVDKGIKPTVIGKATLGNMDKFYNNANQAVRTIAENKNNLNLVDEAGEAIDKPETMNQFAQAIDQTKKQIYQKYNAISTASGAKGAGVDVKPLTNALDGITKDLSYNPDARAYAEKLSGEISELQNAAPDIVEKRIADLNNSLKGFYEGRIKQVFAQIDGSAANLLRQQLDKTITESVGEGYQDLKNQYGALRSIENEVNKRSLVMARQNAKGLTSLPDIFLGGDLVSGIATGNPALIGRAVVGKGIEQYQKYLNNPNTYIKKMFDKAYDVIPASVQSDISNIPIQTKTIGNMANPIPYY
jgi:hypothetical protein